MKITKAEKFTLDEIYARFEELTQIPFVWTTKEVEGIDWDFFSAPTESEDSRVAIMEAPKKVESKRVLKPTSSGQTYSYKSWLKRIFHDNNALKPKRQEFASIPVDFLHSRFRWRRFVEFDEKYSQSQGKYKFNGERVAQYWLSKHLGFFNWKGNIVQLNPAELFLLQFLPDKHRDINKVISEVRVISIPDDDYNWTYSTFRYYFLAMIGVEYAEGLHKRRAVPAGIREHWVSEGYESIQYLVDKGLYKQDLLSQLSDLGMVYDFGYDAHIEAAISDTRIKEDGSRANLRDYQEWFLTNKDWMVYNNGGFERRTRYTLNIGSEDEILNEDLIRLSNYLKTISNRKDALITIPSLKTDIVRESLYPEAMVKRKTFIQDVLSRDAGILGYTISQTTKKVADPSNGGALKNSRFLKVEAPKAGKRRNKK